MEIWEERARFQTTSQRFAELAWIMIKKGWFSDLEILKIYKKKKKEKKKESRQQDSNTIIDTPKN